MSDYYVKERISWVTRPEVEYINSLCPTSADFPVPHHSRAVGNDLEDVFRRAFLRLRDEWRSRLIPAVGDLNKSEMKVFLAIERKTLSYNKLMEKMPRRLFTRGEEGFTGEPRRNNLGSPVLLSTSINDRNLGRAISGLIEKGKISRIESLPHPLYGVSSIYCPMPILDAIQALLTYAFDAAETAGPGHEVDKGILAIRECLERHLSTLVPDLEEGDANPDLKSVPEGEVLTHDVTF